MVGCCGGLGQSSSAGASYNLDASRAIAFALAVGADGGCSYIFTLLYVFSPLLPLFVRLLDID